MGEQAWADRPVDGSMAAPDWRKSAVAELGLMVDRLRRVREGCGLTQAALGAGLGVSALAITNWERGVDTPGVGNFLRWAEALGQVLVVGRPVGGAHGSVIVPRSGEALESFRYRVLAAHLAHARFAGDRTQEMVGDALGVSAWSVHMWETARRVPRLLRLIGWCQYLNVPLRLKPHGCGTR